MIRPRDLKDDDVWAILRAARDGDLGQVKGLVARRSDLARAEYNYTPPIHFAVREGHLEIVRFLVEHGADVSSYRTYPSSDSLLTMAEDREYREIVTFLLELAAKRFPVVEGLAEFLEVVKRADIDRVRQMLAENPQLARASDDTRDTALHRAAALGHFELIILLLDAGAAVDAVRGDGFRPINCALSRGQKPAVNAGATAGILFGRGAVYNIYLAAVFGDAAYVRESLARDPSLANFEDTSHSRPISAAARRNDLDMVKVLLAHGANPSLPEDGAPLGGALNQVRLEEVEMVRGQPRIRTSTRWPNLSWNMAPTPTPRRNRVAVRSRIRARTRRCVSFSSTTARMRRRSHLMS
jgi:ankyrin repeat protein